MGLSSFFNRSGPIEAPAAALADINGLFQPVDDKSSDMKKARAGWRTMRDWLLIAFHVERERERDRGAAIDALDLAMRAVGDILDRAPDDARSVLLPRHEIGIIRANVDQMLLAARYLETVYAGPHLRAGDTGIARDFNNPSDRSRLAGMYIDGACHVRDAHERLKAWLDKTGVVPASEKKIDAYARRMALFN